MMKFYRFASFLSLPALLLACFGLTLGCKDRNSVQVYNVSKEDPAPSPPQVSPGMPPMMQGGTQQGGMSSNCPIIGPATQASAITDTPPSNWEKKPASAMRQASYVVHGKEGAQADISLIILSGAAGGPLDNVNRWLAQLGQPSVNQQQLDQMAQSVDAPLGKVTLVDLQGKPEGADSSKDGRILAGQVEVNGGTWFFKMRGNPEVAGAEKDHFLKWIASVNRTATAPSAAAPSTVVNPPSAPSDDTGTKPKVAWTLPSDWKTAQGSQMRYASFTAAGENGATADISVSFFPGSVGGDLGNVNRWRNQIGLSPVTEADLQTLVVPVTGKEGTIKTIELLGADSKVLAAWISIDGNTWFFKLTAPAALADKQKDSFKSFLESVKFHP